MTQQKVQVLTPFDVLDKAIPRAWIPMIQQNSPKFTDNGAQNLFQLQNDGYGSRMMVMLQLTVTVAGTVTGGTIQPNGPWTAVKNIVFGPNGTVQLRNHSGWSLYKHNRYRWGFDFQSRGKNDLYSGQAKASLGISQSGSGAQIATTVTSGATSATQTIGSTAGILPGDFVYFVTAAVYRQVSSITSETVLVLTASVTSTTAEIVYKANSSNSGGAGLIPFGGAPIVAGTYVINLPLPMPIAYNMIGQHTLLDLNNQSTYTLGLTSGNLIGSLGSTGGTSDLFNALTGSGLTYTVSGQYYATYEVFPWLDTSVYNYADQYDEVLCVIDQPMTIGAGQNPLLMPRADKYAMVLMELQSSGAPLPDSQLANLTISYGGAQIMWNVDRFTSSLRSLCDHEGLPPMDGVWDVDLGLRTGQLNLRDTFDNFKNSAINNWTINPTITGSVTSGQALLTMEQLNRA